MKIKMAMTWASALALLGCGGTNVSFEELQARGANYLTAVDVDEFRGRSFEETSFDETPKSGEADYTGIVFVRLVVPEEVGGSLGGSTVFSSVGSATMVADFEQQLITGAADSFYEIDTVNKDDLFVANGEAIEGSLTYEFVEQSSNLRAAADEVPPIMLVGGFSGVISPTTLDEFVIDLEGTGRYVGEDAAGFFASSDNGNDSPIGDDELIPFVDLFTYKD